MDTNDLVKVVRGILVVLKLEPEDAVYAYEEKASKQAVEALSSPEHPEHANYDKFNAGLSAHLEKVRKAIKEHFTT